MCEYSCARRYHLRLGVQLQVRQCWMYATLCGAPRLIHAGMVTQPECPPCLLVFSRRDVECAGTVEHMFDQADVPERVFVGVCEQNHELPGSEEDCTTGMC